MQYDIQMYNRCSLDEKDAGQFEKLLLQISNNIGMHIVNFECLWPKSNGFYM